MSAHRQATDEQILETTLITLTRDHIIALVKGPQLPPHDIPMEAFGPYAEIIDRLWKANEEGKAAVKAEWRAIIPVLRQMAPKLWAAISEMMPPPLETYTANQLMRKRFSRLRWAVEPFLPEGVTLIAGKPGIGKSYFALNLALAVATGGKALGSLSVEQGPVLYLGLEDSERRMQERIACEWEDEAEWPDDLHFVHENVPRIDTGLLQCLEDWLTDHQRARLVVIDMLAEIRPPRRTNGDWYAEDMALGHALSRLAHRYHIAILVLHHTNRLRNADDPLDMVNGTTGLTGGADVKAVLLRGHGECDAILALRGRDVPEQKVALKFHEGDWQLLGPADEYRFSQDQRDIIAFLRGSTEPVTPKNVATALGKDHQRTKKLMWTMAQRGDIEQAQYGHYAYRTRNSENSRNHENSRNSENSFKEQPQESSEEFPRVPGDGTLQGQEIKGKTSKSSKSSQSSKGHNKREPWPFPKAGSGGGGTI
jgi:hypothetical protein